jgi:hypothetical protein
MWDDYLLFHNALMRYNSFQLRVVGLGLNDNQKEFIRKQHDTTLIELPDELTSNIATIDQDWKKWYKPLYFMEAADGLDTFIWLDTDTIITGELDQLFTRAQQGFFVLQDYFAPQYCQNKPDLYTHYGLQQPTDHRVLNSGVWGGEFPRDQIIIDRWIQNVKDAHINKAVYDSVTLHDQGTLLLALHQLGMIDSILNIKKWNYPARRLLYDNSVDIVDAVKSDHPEGLIIHYAGVPKLPHLQALNHQRTDLYFKSRCGNFDTVKTFVTGSEHLLLPMVTLMRRGSRMGGWFHFSEMPLYADLMRTRFEGRKVTLNTNYTHFLNRTDCPYSCTISPYFGPLFSEFSNHWPNARFAVVLGDPLDTIKYKLRHFKIWPEKLPDTPGFYQSLYGRMMRQNQSLNALNRKRIVINQLSGLIQHCIDEMLWYLRMALEFVSSIPNGRIIWADTVVNGVDELTIDVNPKVFDRAWPKALEEPNQNDQVETWINEFVNNNRQYIIDGYFGLLAELKITAFKMIL